MYKDLINKMVEIHCFSAEFSGVYGTQYYGRVIGVDDDFIILDGNYSSTINPLKSTFVKGKRRNELQPTKTYIKKSFISVINLME